MLTCIICGFQAETELVHHIHADHGSVKDYLNEFPLAHIVSPEIEQLILGGKGTSLIDATSSAVLAKHFKSIQPRRSDISVTE
ncbi:MAG: hypothetical protein A2268_00900 [Candidatus Raymondbacteria bacterium RifOxyA12_full_50_37]|uniref:Uncharacterized protein n=1 Tax=Candidatus Raymondbacteria bacterium RIFOXYD12_FULL_49_13 TaxID=1817890 RepID=A0A1F7FG90_UNCRA|nr:MAG: hypothetical protein A2268_00900 [Candidatus Raymondbacteria bacterium RifOxyA12_full_50_37]OGJ86361.1 MAG: hypothetical protein A2248_13865 [Candidatus Raymondbacteria bacterium RIFOXYA2_FULL_49_16]OGJ95531.1 MAG: hypothetical protein A2453_12640 [Candidatus Raymondbacteria bacterium RIFOXYC2_FULL_50_21]OGJ96106.1 MAG: hypothetical protein A2487_01745 [Candidatus Raymondbacteria bacterium RifOxyC12_full_50_8]OGJ96258.1 MAG: hypothetical protein A2350_02330 [Candidatus Raymondbacteria b